MEMCNLVKRIDVNLGGVELLGHWDPPLPKHHDMRELSDFVEAAAGPPGTEREQAKAPLGHLPRKELMNRCRELRSSADAARFLQ